LAILRFVVQPDGVGFDRDAALAFEIHVVQYLADMSRPVTAPVNSSRRSASVDLPLINYAR